MNPTHCKHFNGDHHNKTCCAGVAYADVTPEPGRTMGLSLRRPCHFQPFGHPNSSPAQIEEHAKRGTCAKFELPTAAEIAEDEREIHAAIDRMMKLAPLISAVKKEHRGKSWSGVLVCPICGTKLHVGHARCNGHTRGQCETPNCVNWIE